MRFSIEVKQSGENRVHSEIYDYPDIQTHEQAYAWAVDTIASFNGSLRPGELARELCGVTMLGESKGHTWQKSNLVTLHDEELDRMYDTAKCNRCGATGKRFGLSEYIVPDDGYTYVCYPKKGDR